MNDELLTFRIPSELKKQIEKYAEADERTLAAQLRYIITKWIIWKKEQTK